MPGTKTIASAIVSINEINDVYPEKIKFLSGLALHNDETLKKYGSPVGENVTLAIPMFQLDKSRKENTIKKDWKENSSWRTYTSYEATKILISGLKELDKNTSDKIDISKRKEIVLEHLNEWKKSQNSPNKEDNLELCLMDFKDTQENKHDKSACRIRL